MKRSKKLIALHIAKKGNTTKSPHHLKALRLAGLAHLSLETHGERHYAARIEAINELNSLLHNFVESESGEMTLE